MKVTEKVIIAVYTNFFLSFFKQTSAAFQFL